MSKPENDSVTTPLLSAIAAATLLTPFAMYLPGVGINTGVEDRLTAEAVELLAETSGAEIEFNGRDGYLDVPAGTDGETLAAELADEILGVRDIEPRESAFESDVESQDVESQDVESENDDAGNDEDADTSDSESGDEVSDVTPTDDDASPESPDASESATSPDPEESTADTSSPAYGFTWNGTTWTQDGSAPANLSTTVEALVESPDVDPSLDAPEGVQSALDTLSGIFEEDLLSGSIAVQDRTLTVSGIGTDPGEVASVQGAVNDIPNVTGTISPPSESDRAQTELDALAQFGTIEFVTGTSTPTAETDGLIDRIAEVLNNRETISIEIDGHTDAQGDEDNNQQLSQDRANAILDALVARGISAERMTATGYGESRPIADNETPEGRQANRRVEITAKESE